MAQMYWSKGEANCPVCAETFITKVFISFTITKPNYSYFYFYFLIDVTASEACIEIVTPEIRAEMSPKGNQTASFGLMLFLLFMLCSS